MFLLHNAIEIPIPAKTKSANKTPNKPSLCVKHTPQICGI